MEGLELSWGVWGTSISGRIRLRMGRNEGSEARPKGEATRVTTEGRGDDKRERRCRIRLRRERRCRIRLRRGRISNWGGARWRRRTGLDHDSSTAQMKRWMRVV
jgi:hypothetical protein